MRIQFLGATGTVTGSRYYGHCCGEWHGNGWSSFASPQSVWTGCPQHRTLRRFPGWPEIMSWLSHFSALPKQTFMTHGEPDAADALRLYIEEKLHWPCNVPDYLQQIDLT
jgi:Cft2 family RNA processing exonuclease